MEMLFCNNYGIRQRDNAEDEPKLFLSQELGFFFFLSAYHPDEWTKTLHEVMV